MPSPTFADTHHLSLFERVLSLFTKMRAGEGRSAFLLLANAFLILLAYYVLRPLREALILTEFSAEVKSYATAVIAAILMFLVPLYGILFRHARKVQLIQWITLFFMVNLVLLYLMGVAGMQLGFIYYVWLGIFGVMVVAQFWAFAADLFNVKSGQRLFPLIMVGASLGALAGAQLSKALFALTGPFGLMLVACGILGLSLFFMRPARAAVPTESRSTTHIEVEGQLERTVGAFGIVMQDGYLRLVALFVVLLNWINSTGEYILARVVVQYADELVASGATVLDKGSIINAFYGEFIFWFTLIGVLLQMFVVSRLFRFIGVAGALLIAPVIAMVGYGFVVFIPIFSIIRVVKILENASDYSITNTARHALFLPTTQAAKYEGKTAIDTFFWRFGDLIQAGFVYAGLTWFDFGVAQFAALNMALAAGWFIVAHLIGRRYRQLALTNALNVPPKVMKPIPDAIWDGNGPVRHTFDPDTFCDADPGDVLTLSARLQGGAALPQWLRFDPRQRLFSGLPPESFAEELLIEVVATDFDGTSAIETFRLVHARLSASEAS